MGREATLKLSEHIRRWEGGLQHYQVPSSSLTTFLLVTQNKIYKENLSNVKGDPITSYEGGSKLKMSPVGWNVGRKLTR